MRFRFTLQYEEEQVEINEPDGFADCVLKLARDKDFHSLIEFFDGSFIFYGDNGVINGGIHNIKEWEQRGGPDATILVFIDFTLDDTNYFQLFSGQLDLSLAEEIPDNKMRIPIIRDDFWAKFYNRKDTPVDLQAVVDLDGADIIPVSPIDLNLISQIIKKTSLWRGFASIGDWEFDLGYLVTVSSPPATVEEEIVLWSQVTTIKEINEITESYELGLAFEDTEPIINIVKFIDEGGDMEMNWKFRIALNFDLRYLPITSDATKIQSVEVQTDLYYRLNDDPITFLEGENHTNTFTPYTQASGVQKNLAATIYQDFNLIPGLYLTVEPDDELFFYAKHTITFTYEVSGDDPNSANWVSRTMNGFIANYGGLDEDPYTRIEFDSIFRNTISPGFFVHDSGAAILKSHGIGENPFYSEFFGSAETLARQYESDGCGWRHANAKGLHVRGWAIQEKPYSMSFMQWWKGLYPIFNLSLTYDEIFGPSEESWTPDEFPAVASFNWVSVTSGTWAPGDTWTLTGTSVLFTASGGLAAGTLSDIIKPLGYTVDPGHTYQYHYEIRFDDFGLTDQCQVHFHVYDIGGVILFTQSTAAAFIFGSFTQADTVNFVMPAGAYSIGIVLEWPVGTTDPGSGEIEVWIDETEPTAEGDGEIIPVIRVEQLEEVFDPNFIVEISNIRQITRKYDTEKIYNKIEIGYTDWKAEATSGLNDPQTKRVYSTRFKKIGQAIQIFSDWIAASITWEETRRQSVDRTKDYKFDDNTFILRLSDQGSSGGYDPEFDENFSSITNLNNPDRRYNIGLSVARNFLRFRKWLNGCLDKYVGSVYKFVSGEGNYDMTSTMNPQSPDCMDEDFDGEDLSEKQDIPVTNENIHLTYHYTIECPMSLIDYLRTVRFRKKAIGISLTDSDHVALFIDELSYKPVKGTVQISGWSKEYIDIHPVAGVAPTQQCFPSTECENALTDEFGEIITDEEGVCITA